jgi:hypothetical protein
VKIRHPIVQHERDQQNRGHHQAFPAKRSQEIPGPLRIVSEKDGLFKHVSIDTAILIWFPPERPPGMSAE